MPRVIAANKASSGSFTTRAFDTPDIRTYRLPHKSPRVKPRVTEIRARIYHPVSGPDSICRFRSNFHGVGPVAAAKMQRFGIETAPI